MNGVFYVEAQKLSLNYKLAMIIAFRGIFSFVELLENNFKI
jgi:hypothetical protein